MGGKYQRRYHEKPGTEPRLAVTPVPWPAVGAFVAGVGTVALILYLLRHRGKPGVAWFVAALAAQAGWALLHSVALLSFDPAVRRVLETAIWVPVSFIGFLFLGFALIYTGRGEVVRSRWFGLVAAVPVASVALAVTNPVHGLVWTDFRIEPVYGAAAVAYEFGPWAYVMMVAGLAFAAVGVLLMVDTVLSYGPLYRGEAVAIGLSTAPIGAATLAWGLGVGPAQPLNLVPLSFLPHLVLDTYAFVGNNMFETNPTTRRAAEEDAVEGLGNPVLVLDPQERVVDANEAARSLFGLREPAYFGTAVTDVVGDGFDPATAETVTVTDRGRREFAVSTSPLVDPTGTNVGQTAVFQDITEEKRREQRLEVLNRVLRHNLRNEMTTISAYASMIGESADDEGVRDGATIIAERGRELVEIGDTAREFEQAVDDPTAIPLELGSHLREVAADAAAQFPAATVVVEGGDHEVRTDPTLLTLAVENLVEEMLADDADATVRLTVAATDSGVELVVTTDGPGLPDEEMETLRVGEERPLQHGQGIGLWIVQWSVEAVGGQVDFTDNEGQEVRIRLPEAGLGASDGRQ